MIGSAKVFSDSLFKYSIKYDLNDIIPLEQTPEKQKFRVLD